MEKIISAIKYIFNRKIFKIIGWAFLIIFISVSIHAIGFNARCRNAAPHFKPVNDEIPQEFKAAADDIENYYRPEESTYLTFPEWYLVFNPQEYAQFIKNNKPSNFPYFTSINQFWSGYCQVYGITKNNYPFNLGVHFMEAVLGTSVSVEYSVKGIWENTIGRITEWTSFPEQTEEDIYAGEVAEEYGNFIPTDPWYEFPFGQKLFGLWQDTSFFGPHMVRKLERKIFLSLEYGIKTGYAFLIRVGTHAVYGIADTEIYAGVKNTNQKIFENENIRKIKDLGNNSYIITLPHYQGFTDTVPTLAPEDIQFVDIAGNDEILLTAVIPENWNYNLKDGVVLFTMDMLTSNEKRIAIQVPVRSLSAILAELQKEGVRIEHLYDY